MQNRSKQEFCGCVPSVPHNREPAYRWMSTRNGAGDGFGAPCAGAQLRGAEPGGAVQPATAVQTDVPAGGPWRHRRKAARCGLDADRHEHALKFVTTDLCA